MRRFYCLVALLMLAAVPAARAQLPAYYMVGNEPPYRDQGSYGTCWTFGAMASIETNIIKEGLPGYDATAGLSERDMAWNNGFISQIAANHYVQNGSTWTLSPETQLQAINDGGTYLMAAAYLARGAGPLTAAQAPYSGMATAPPTGQVVPYYVRDIEWYHNVADIKQALTNYGAVATCWEVYYESQDKWLSTSSGVTDSSKPLYNKTVYYDPGPGIPNPPAAYLNQPDHAPAIVGWNDSAACPAGGGTGAWVIRNSWGSSTQHFGVSYNDFYTGNDTPDTGAFNCGGVSFHNVVPNTYQHIYYHNDFGWTNQQPHAYAFNHFTASQNGSLKSVSFYTTGDDVGYTVNVYKQFQNGALGQLASTISGSEAYEGFHTIDLRSMVSLSQGQDFYIELQTSNSQEANDGNVSLERLLGFSGDPGIAHTTALPGESYFSDNGATWTDLQTADTSANFAIDGLTVAAPEPSSLAVLASLVACGLSYTVFRRVRRN